MACANYIHFLLYIYTSIVFFIIYYVTFFHKTKHVFSIQTTVLTCRQIFPLHQSICKTEVGRVKVNSTNNWNSRWQNSIQHDNIWLTAWVTTGVKQNQNWRWWTCCFVLNVICGKKYIQQIYFCVCVKGIILCNCLCSSSFLSSRFSASIINNIREFGEKNHFTDHRKANTIQLFVPIKRKFFESILFQNKL